MSSERDQLTRTNLDALTGLRFLAALCVVTYHYGQAAIDPTSVLRRWAAAGYVGVDFFYLLSGFVLSYAYPPNENIQRRPFWAARLARIYPVYVLGLLLSLPLFYEHVLARRSLDIALPRAIATTLLHLTLTHAWVSNVGQWNVPDWSVSCEWAFYLTFPWLAPRLFRTRRPFRWAVTLWLAGLVLPLWAHLMHPSYIGHAGAPDFLSGLLEYHPFARLHEFAIGILCARIWDTHVKSRRLPAGVTAVALSMPMLVLTIPGLPHLPVSNGLLAPLFAVILLVVPGDRGPVGYLLRLPIARLLGDASYAMYILHWPLWYGWTRLLNPIRLGPTASFSTYLVVLIVASTACYRYFENPLRRLLRSRLNVARA